MNITQFITRAFKSGRNKFNQAFLWAVNGFAADYDPKGKTYIQKGYSYNPVVYAVINAMAVKTSSVPIYVKEVKDKAAFMKLDRLRMATKRNTDLKQLIKTKILESKAFKEGEAPFPLERPNPTQTWTEIIQLYKTFLKVTGNAYFYLLAPEEGRRKGQPMAVYCLPSHQIEIVVKKDADLLGIDNPIKSYMLIEGRAFIEFPADKVIHIKYPNPNYGPNGTHLYGMAPTQPLLKNIESSNSGLDLNIKTLKSGGAFGFIHGKSHPLTEPQAKEIKSRLLEMNASPEDLSKIAGVSAELGFTRMSLTSEELKPFDYFKFDQKTICNVYGWSDSLLNNDDGGKYDKQKEERKRVVTDNIVPDLELLTNAFNDQFLPRFQGYENKRLEFDIMELPEMQEDMEKLSKWLYEANDRAVINRAEVRAALGFPAIDNPLLEAFTVTQDVLTLEEALDPTLGLTAAPIVDVTPANE